ncbi:MAG: hypothetical protein R2844_14430 [Caldilineales bacterium]
MGGAANRRGSAARQTLSEAEELVVKTGYVRVLLDIPALVGRSKFAQRPEEQVASAPPAEADQLLTDQEQAVLALLADELTLRADRRRRW